MRFEIERASRREPTEPPCKGAVLEWKTITQSLRQTYSDADEWHGEGANHREENGLYLREIRLPVWYIEVPDLAALIDLCAQTGGSLIVNYESKPVSEASITIYDDYIE